MRRESVLLGFLENLGAHLAERRGRTVAVHFGDPAWEYDVVRRSAGLIDRTDIEMLRFRGADRVRFLENMLTGDVKTLEPGQGAWSAVLTPKGKFVALFRLLCFADSFLALLEPGSASVLARALEPFAILEDVEISDESERHGIVHLAGPESTRLLAAVSGSAIPHAPLLAHRPLSLPGLRGGAHAVRECATGEDGFDLLVPSGQIADAWRALLRHETPKAHPVGADAYEVLRLEAGTPLFGVDVGPEIGPIEAGLEGAVSFRKGCYPGQEVVAKTHYRGKPPKRLVGLAIEGDESPAAGAVVLAGDEEAGRITSAVRSRNPGSVIAFALVRTGVLEKGLGLHVRHGDSLLAARPAELPFR
ncbi:MAG: aminomethyl transferase family protein [Candidatus Latescibacterota bacterium]|nr:MAG: aminomethyl transferase family protein [Candidatus Latescibacterota bacterium]